MDQNKPPRASILLSRWLNKFNMLPKATQITLLLGLLAGVIVLLGMLTQSQPVDPEESFINLLVNVTLKLAVVLLLIYISAIIFKKIGFPSMQKKTQNMDIIETLALSPKRALYIVKIGKQSLLIGATDQSINLIKELENDKEVFNFEQADALEDFNQSLPTSKNSLSNKVNSMISKLQ